MQEVLLSTIIGITVLLFIASLAAIIFKRINFPYTIGLVIIGILLGFLSSDFKALIHIDKAQLTPELILYILLPVLIFESSVNIDAPKLIKNISPVMALAGPGLLLSTVLIAVPMAVFTPLSWGNAFLFGALISATDPVAVIGLFNQLGAPKRLKLLVDGESLFNDATAIVVCNIIKAAVISGAAFSFFTIAKGAWEFFYVFFGGIAVGAILGYLMIFLLKFVRDDPIVEVAFSTVVAYTAFIVADHYLGVSGVMSAMGAGIVFSWFGTTRLSPEVRDYLKKFWGFAAFAANSFIFLLLGFDEKLLLSKLREYPRYITFIIVGIIALLFSRAVVVYGIVPLLRYVPKAQNINLKYQTVMFWGGLRGAVPIALVLSLPVAIGSDQLNIIMALTFGSVLFTLLVQGTSMGWLIHLLGLDKQGIYEKASRIQAMLAARKHALERLSKLDRKGYYSKDEIKDFMHFYSTGNLHTKKVLHKIREDEDFPNEALRQVVWTSILSVEHQTYRELLDKGLLSEKVFRELIREVELRTEHHVSDPPAKIIKALPVVFKVEGFLFKLMEKAAPKFWLAKRILRQMLTFDFEKISAIIIAWTRLTPIFDDYRKLFQEYPEPIENCRKYYDELYKFAELRLKAIEHKFPEEIDFVKRRNLLEGTLDAERETIEAMGLHGEIPEAVGNSLISELDNTLAKARKAQRLDNLADFEIS